MKKIFIFLIALLFISCPAPKKSIKTDSSEVWMGVYLQKQKIGYSFFQIQKVQEHYKMTHRFKINLAMMGQEQEVISNFIGYTDSGFALVKFDFSFSSSKNAFSASGEVKDKKLTIEVKSGGSTKTASQDLGGPIFPVSALGNLAVKRNFEEARDYDLHVFDATLLKVEDAKVRVLGKEKLNINNKNYNLTKMTVTMLGLTTTMWIDNNGIERKEESAPSMTIIEETREQALVQEAAMGKLDILSMFSIKTDTIITDARKVKYLKIKMTGADFSSFKLTDNYQTVLQDNPLILEIKVPDSLLFVDVSSLNNDRGEEFLKPTLCIQSDAKELKEQAHKIIIGSENDKVKSIEKIMNWVYTNINKRPTASLPSALDVLKTREGDCNEHAVLFAALCRAVGIPCQICVGLVYVENGFYYHAWNKVLLNNWIAVDPTFGQFPIDATHIKLSEGELDEQAKVLSLVGEVKIKVLEFK
jgi:uncharacterized protein YcfL